MQARAEATRRLIVNTAVDLFDKVGFAGASLADIIAATGVSKGSFYYHFENRESVAAAIIAEADARLQSVAQEILADSSSRALANLIRTVFTIADLNETDTLLRVGVELRGGLGQISTELEGFEKHRMLFTEVIANAVAEGDVLPGLDVDQVGFTLWSAVLGSHQHCGATRERLQNRLAAVFTVMLPGICTPDAARGYTELAQGLAGQHITS